MRILILAYYFPPLNSTASHRPYSWAAAWAKAGHEIHVLTTDKYAFDGVLDLGYDLSGFTVHSVGFLKRAPRASSDSGAAAKAQGAARRWDRLKRVTRRIRLGAGMFAEIAWLAYSPLLARAMELMGRHRFDFVISTSPPEVVHFVAHALSRRTGVPWVADYRDLWFAEMRVNQLRISSWLIGKIKRPRIRRAAAVTTISEGLALRLREFLGREVIVCYNGFMPEVAAGEDRRPWNDSKRHVVYTGRMFPGKRDPQRFFEGLALALREAPALADNLVVDVYGDEEDWIRESANRLGVAACVRMHGLVPHRVSLGAQRHADLLLFLDWMDAKAEGILTGKLFEYLASGRTILGVGSRDDSEAARLIEQAGAGATVTTAEGVRDKLVACASAPATALGPAARAGIERFSRFRQAETLLDRIQSVLRAGATA